MVGGALVPVRTGRGGSGGGPPATPEQVREAQRIERLQLRERQHRQRVILREQQRQNRLQNKEKRRARKRKNRSGDEKTRIIQKEPAPPSQPRGRYIRQRAPPRPRRRAFC